MIVKKPKLIPPIPTAKIIDHINIFAEQAANDTLLKKYLQTIDSGKDLTVAVTTNLNV